jgi:hypothetical protein
MGVYHLKRATNQQKHVHMHQRMTEMERLDEMAPAAEQSCADCGEVVGARPIYMAGEDKYAGLCFKCAEDVERAYRQAKLWAADQLGGSDRKRFALTGMFRLKSQIELGEVTGVWADEFRKAIAILWDTVQESVHGSSVAQKGAAQ